MKRWLITDTQTEHFVQIGSDNEINQVYVLD